MRNKIYAQLCTGSLGDPVVNITFGSGDNPGAPLDGITNYTYTTDGCPQDGYYTIANSEGNCFADTWYYLPEDHTPNDVNGYMMIINASFEPGVFFIKKVDGLCPNTTYQFAAWIYNVLENYACNGNGIKPNITFDIETTSGTVLQTYSTGDITDAGLWKQYGFYFSTTDTASSVVIRMTNNAPGGCGNDLLLDDITFRACGPLVTANINGSLDSADVCTGNTSIFTLHANVSSGYKDPVYQWQVSTDYGATWLNIAGANDTVYNRPVVIAPAAYQYRMAVSPRNNMNVSSCYILSNVITINVNKYPVPAAATQGNCTEDTLSLAAKDGVLFSWTGPSGFSSSEQNPSIANASLANAGKYYVMVTSAKGCASIDSAVAMLYTKPTVSAGEDADVCEQSGVQLQGAFSNNVTGLIWYPASELTNSTIANPMAYPVQTTTFILTVANNKCKVSDSVLVTVNKLPTADAGPDKVIIAGQSATLNGVAGGTDINYEWMPDKDISGAETLTPVVNPLVNTAYILSVTSGKGCGVANDTALVKVFKQLYIPNAFTPNGDGINDVWFIETLEAYPGAEVKVYNRYGQLVFDNNGANTWWDGKYKGLLQTAGAFVYIIDLKNNTPVIKGVLYLIL